jgi:hypothetical protein
MKMLGKDISIQKKAPDLLKDLLEDLEADIKLKARERVGIKQQPI